jgi:hypothetical protein
MSTLPTQTTTTPLGAGESYTSPLIRVSEYGSLHIHVKSDENCDVEILWRNDGNADRTSGGIINYVAADAPDGDIYQFPISGTSFQYKVTALTTPQTYLLASVFASYSPYISNEMSSPSSSLPFYINIYYAPGGSTLNGLRLSPFTVGQWYDFSSLTYIPASPLPTITATDNALTQVDDYLTFRNDSSKTVVIKWEVIDYYSTWSKQLRCLVDGVAQPTVLDTSSGERGAVIPPGSVLSWQVRQNSSSSTNIVLHYFQITITQVQ